MIKYSKEYFDTILTKEQFISCLNELADDFKNNNAEWENLTINDYLSSIAAWVEASKFEQNFKMDWSQTDFRLISLLFYTGKVYE